MHIKWRHGEADPIPSACLGPAPRSPPPYLHLVLPPTHSPVDSTPTCGRLCTCTSTAPTVARMPTSAMPTSSPAASTAAPALQEGGREGGRGWFEDFEGKSSLPRGI